MKLKPTFMNDAQKPAKGIAIPTKESNRLEHIDIIRGVAILGILLMNILIFGLPEHDFASVHGWLDGSPLNEVYRIVTVVFFDGNMRGLFCLLFGAGIILFSQQCERNNTSIFLLFRRMWWLALLGLFDIFVVLWDGDILYEYAICGFVLIFFRKLKPVYLLLLSFCILVFFIYQNNSDHDEAYSDYVQYKKNESLYNSDHKLTKAQKENKKEWEELRNIFPPYSTKQITQFQKDKREQIAERQGNYIHVFNVNKKYWADVIDLESYIGILSEVLVMLVGMALFKMGWISTVNRKRNLILACVGLGLGISMSAFMAYNQPLNLEELTIFLRKSFSFGTYFFPTYNLFITVGFMALILLFCSSSSYLRIKKALASVGKMAFTNYFLQSIICTLLFNGYGLGLFGEFERYQVYFFVPFVWAINIALSVWWMKHYYYGPMEWVWRTLTYWKRIHNKRSVQLDDPTS